MSAQHTPGRLETDLSEHDAPYQDIALRVGRRNICRVGIDDAPCHDYNTEQIANARRLVACWNACEKVSTDDLEAMVREADLSWVMTIDILVRQRDELMAALLTARDHIDMEALEISHCKDAERIRAAIAKAEGGAA